MNEQDIKAAQEQIVERHVAAQIKVAEMQQAEAVFRARAAQLIAQREEETTEATRRTHEKLERQADNCMRPSALFRPDVRTSDDQWTATFGDVVGIGPTPDLACQDFDRKWLGKDEI